jgi:predicted DNA-binding transcriptional regulator AlpA
MKGDQNQHRTMPVLDGGEIMSQMPERLLTPKEVAEILAVSPAWVLDHSSRRRPHLPSVKLGKAVRFRAIDVAQFIHECARMRGAVA